MPFASESSDHRIHAKILCSVHHPLHAGLHLHMIIFRRTAITWRRPDSKFIHVKLVIDLFLPAACPPNFAASTNTPRGMTKSPATAPACTTGCDRHAGGICLRASVSLNSWRNRPTEDTRTAFTMISADSWPRIHVHTSSRSVRYLSSHLSPSSLRLIPPSSSSYSSSSSVAVVVMLGPAACSGCGTVLRATSRGAPAR